jgi:D-amino-acid dehydrogenase
MTRTVAVLGAGIVGICCALALQKRGVPTVLVDRDEPARGASFGNAGAIQAEAVTPYALPRAPGAVATLLGNRTTAFHYTLRGMAQAAPALWRYWHASGARGQARATEAYAPLIRRARAAHEALIAETQAEACVGGAGLTEIYRDTAVLAARRAEAESVRDRWGVGFETWEGTPPPTLSGITGPVAGGLTWTETLAVTDPHALAIRYLDRYRSLQGRVLRGEARMLRPAAGGWTVATESGPVTAAHVVLCLGAAINDLSALTGIRVPLIPKRGYHAHYAPNPERALAHPVVDVEQGYVVAPMQAGWRLTTGAQLLGRDEAPNPVQIARAERQARQLFALGERRDAQPWTGVRPCTADMLPLIGPVKARPGLWFATGHGHQGLTLAAITGELLAEALTGGTPALPLAPYAPDRFAA